MSAPIATILVAVDPGEASRSAFAEALRLAQFLKVRLLVVSVTPRYEGNMHRWKIANADARLNEPFVNCLEEMQEIAAKAGQPVEAIHAVGDPVEEIVRLADEEQAGLVVLGYPKRSLLERVLLGRTAARVIGYSPCDVLMIPEQSVVNFNRILVGIDGSRYSMEAGERALHLAAAFGGEVHALSVLDIPLERSMLYGVVKAAEQKQFPPLRTLAEQGQRLGVRVQTEIREGSPYATIVKYGQDKEVDLIVLGSYGRTELGDILMGSVVERVASLSALPTLVVKKS